MNSPNKAVPNNTVTPPEFSNNEPELFDILIAIWRGKKIVILAIIVALIIGTAYLVLSKKQWMSTAVVTLPSAGQVANYDASLSVIYAQNPRDKPSLVDLQNQLFVRFSASMNALSNALENLEDPLVLRINQVTAGNNDALSISFVGPGAKDAQQQLAKYISDVNTTVVSDYGEDMKRNLSVKARELTHSLDVYKQVAINKKEHRIDVIKQALLVAEASGIQDLKVDQAETLSDDTLYLLGSKALNAMLQNESTKPLSYGDDYYQAERSLLSITHLQIQVDNLQSFRYISAPDLPIRNDGPKTVLTLILSAILGLILGTAIILIRLAAIGYRSRH
ncbi:Chain length determinant protein [Pantoea ananatis]|uniref:LPS O-antigen chain length determinant protein WzzB n=1 Tax=Pantoea ananas TaxID=553 RepID=UPI000B7D4718|nr:LPS O-antigen chain length determinant protein WzzB [Pantoea ananatis]AWQ18195.1 LPS O-antigen chain length determinant protein WzzB [Pantoea ananatis]MBN6030080.1 LPS O-antigen chain length determinant protein WzzB [Pantoea ananatis]MCK0554192.1 LPS O-antigen chain length determinant protein WzzB [Pantoea ananatis]MCW0315871.1 Chain length determinant protein [Pantoea ananatis]MCW0334012.1 Chain length determinant protein [Pantoea ananatis]